MQCTSASGAVIGRMCHWPPRHQFSATSPIQARRGTPIRVGYRYLAPWHTVGARKLLWQFGHRTDPFGQGSGAFVPASHSSGTPLRALEVEPASAACLAQGLSTGFTPPGVKGTMQQPLPTQLLGGFCGSIPAGKLGVLGYWVTGRSPNSGCIPMLHQCLYGIISKAVATLFSKVKVSLSVPILCHWNSQEEGRQKTSPFFGQQLKTVSK